MEVPQVHLKNLISDFLRNVQNVGEEALRIDPHMERALNEDNSSNEASAVYFFHTLKYKKIYGVK